MTGKLKKGTSTALLLSSLVFALGFLALPADAEAFYRKGEAPPNGLCPLWCKYNPCCPPPQF